MYVVRKLMLAPKSVGKTQRHKLFRTRCSILSKVFALIIDSGSQENIIGKKVVKNSNLPVEKHRSPCSIG